MTDSWIARIDLFADLEPALQEDIASLGRPMTFHAGQEIVGYQDPSTDVYFLIDGTVRVTRYSSEGKEVGFHDMGAGETFGLLAALDDKGRAASIVAKTPCRVATMAREAFRDLLRQRPEVAQAVMLHLVALVRTLPDRVYASAVFPVRDRVLIELLRLGRAQAGGANTVQIAPSPTNAEIATWVQARREAVSRTMHQLETEGLIERQGRTLVINDLRRLSEHIEAEFDVSILRPGRVVRSRSQRFRERPVW